MTGRRVHERYDCDIPLHVQREGEEEFTGEVVNISLGGIYCLTDVTIPYGTEVKLRFRVPALKEDAIVAATVRWAKPDGVGFQFGSLRAIEVWALNQFFKNLTPTPPLD